MINAERIEEMKRLTEVVTPGPWEKLNSAGVFTEVGAVNANGVKADDNDGWQIAECCGLVTNVGGILTELTHVEESGNAQFIAESRQFVPDIIAAYEEQAEEIAKLREALGFYADLSNYTEYYESDYVKYGERGTVDILSDKGGKAKEALAWRNTTRK